jgi:hypothetical protein
MGYISFPQEALHDIRRGDGEARKDYWENPRTQNIFQKTEICIMSPIFQPS